MVTSSISSDKIGVNQEARNMPRCVALRIASFIFFLNTCSSFLVSSDRQVTRSEFCFPLPTITSLYENTNGKDKENNDEKKNNDRDAIVEINPIEELLQRQEDEHQQRIIQELKQTHSEQKRVLELEIEELTKNLKAGSTQDLLEQASELQNELKNEIEILSDKLSKAESELLKVTTLEETMLEKRKVLEKEIAVLQRKLEEGIDWRDKYEQTNVTRTEQEGKLLSEIKRLEEEVRAVFSIGRRTSDELVKKLGSELKEKEEEIMNAMNELESKDSYIAQLEEERGSLRKLLGISFGLTTDRLQSRLLRLRKRIRVGIVTPVLTPIEEEKTASENVSVPILKRKSRRSSFS